MNLRSILFLALWGIIALLLFRACSPEEGAAPEIHRAYRAESFDAADAVAPATAVLENEFLRTKWSSRGAACDRVYALDYASAVEDAGAEATEAPAPAGPLLIFDALLARPPAVGEAPSHYHYRQRQGLRLWEPDGRLGVDLDAADWEMSGPTPTAEGGSELAFELTTPTGVRVTKHVRLRAGARAVEMVLTVEPTEQVATEIVGDLRLMLGTGGGILVNQDRFYRNPYTGAAVMKHQQVEKVETFYPNGKLPARRDGARHWKGDVAFVVEGSKYFLSAIRPLDGMPFRGALAEVLVDNASYEREIYAAFPREHHADLTAVANADYRLTAANGVRPDGAALAAETGLPADQAAALRDGYHARVRQLAFGLLPGTWERTSIAGGFPMHVGRAGAAAETRRFQWFLGPKEPRILKSDEYGPLDAIILDVDYGDSFFYRMFQTDLIAPAILWILRMFQGLVSNWGVAIILMTLLVRSLLFPLTRHSQIKMAGYQAKVAKLKPQLEAIGKKYGDNPQKKQEETVKLYREHKMSPPLSGCLPILLQFPVFIGLFAALRCSILLREQPFALWIHDLSRPDALIDFGGPLLDFWPLSGVTTLNVLPIIMVVLWIWHQSAMPMPTDPQQQQVQKMMRFMPILFGVMLYNYAAGLSLYMITSSSLGIFEQKVIRRKWPVPTAADVQPAAGKA